MMFAVHPDDREPIHALLDEVRGRDSRAATARDWALRAMMAREAGSLTVTPEEYQELLDADFDWQSYDQEVRRLLIKGGEFMDTVLSPLPVVVLKRGG